MFVRPVKIPLLYLEIILSLAKADKDKRVVLAKYIDQFSCGRNDTYVITRAFFPIAERDMVVTRYNFCGPDFSCLVSFSIERDDYPPNPKYVRAEMIGKYNFG